MSELTRLDVAVISIVVTTLCGCAIGAWRMLLQTRESDQHCAEQYEMGRRHGMKAEANAQRLRELVTMLRKADEEHENWVQECLNDENRNRNWN